MSQDSATRTGRRILYCHCAFARVVPEEVKDRVLAGLAEADVAFDAVPDLCELAARQDSSLKRLAAGSETRAAGSETRDGGGERLDIVACYPRAVKWLFHAANAPLPEAGVRIHNMRTADAETVLADVFPADVLTDKPADEPTDRAAETEK
jgi:hypothetical protein